MENVITLKNNSKKETKLWQKRFLLICLVIIIINNFSQILSFVSVLLHLLFVFNAFYKNIHIHTYIRTGRQFWRQKCSFSPQKFSCIHHPDFTIGNVKIKFSLWYYKPKISFFPTLETSWCIILCFLSLTPSSVSYSPPDSFFISLNSRLKDLYIDDISQIRLLNS